MNTQKKIKKKIFCSFKEIEAAILINYIVIYCFRMDNKNRPGKL